MLTHLSLWGIPNLQNQLKNTSFTHLQVILFLSSAEFGYIKHKQSSWFMLSWISTLTLVHGCVC